MKKSVKSKANKRADNPNLGADFGEKPTGKVSPTKSIGAPGTAIYGGYIMENEKDARLVGTQKYLTYSNMLANTTIVAAGVRYFLNLTSKATWRVDPAEDTGNDAKAEEMAELVEDMINDMTTPWHRVVRRAAMYRYYGFSIQEWTAKRNDAGNLVMQDIEARPQITIERWDTDFSGTVLGVVQLSPQDSEEIYLPRGKLVYMLDDALNDSPEGLGLFRHIAEVVDQLRRFEQLEGIGYESDLHGIPISRAPLAMLDELQEEGTISAAQRQQIEAPLQQFMNNHTKTNNLGLLLDSSTYRGLGENANVSNIPLWNVELLRSSLAATQEAIARAIDRKQREIARILGVEGLLLGDGDRGSEALSRDKSHNFSLMVDSTLDEIAETMQQDIIGPVWELNAFDEDFKPTFQTEAVQFRDVTQITTAIKDLASSGSLLSNADEAVKQVYDLLGLTPPETLDSDIDLTLTEGTAAPNDPASQEVPQVEGESA